MAKKKQPKVVQMLSPEKYIQQKARTLPIHKCFVNSDWQEDGLASLMVSRRHSNGHLTVGNYLIDLKCLGVKDVGYNFNISEPDFNNILRKMQSMMDVIEISYTLAHNIIYAGLEFAEEYGFKPHRDFTQVAQYILEEDTEDIELMDIECGKDGKPFYISGPYDTEVQKRAILANLVKNAGPGNFNFIFGDDDETDDDETDDDETDDFDESDLYPEFDFDEEEVRNSQTLQLKIAIDDLSNPEVWRRVTVPSYYTFAHLHQLIQLAFDWENEHLYEFSVSDKKSKTIISELEDEPDLTHLEAEETPLGRFFEKKGDKLLYTYDFGDNWTHSLILEKVIPEVSMIPELLDGNGACPPEDCGGAWGYQNLLNILANKKHPEYKEHMEWLGLEADEKWDPNAFDLEKTRLIIAEVFS